MKLRIIIEQEKEGDFVARVPSLRGCLAHGKTKDEALRRMRGAIALYFSRRQESW
ncbi:MAG: type II toxin-antitoxin system HicB family antitoxin [Planctomycetota bacterium]